MKVLTSICAAALSLALFSACNNIFLNMEKKSFPVSPEIPSIDYIFPAEDMRNVKLNQTILVSFNKEMDSASLTTDAFKIVDSDNPGVNLLIDTIDIYEGHIIILTLAELGTTPYVHYFDYSTTYTVTIMRDLVDMEGYTIVAGYSWKFTTCIQTLNQDDGYDLEGPHVDVTTPVDGSRIGAGDVHITALFSEDINPDSLTPSNFTVMKGSGTPASVAGDVTYSIVTDATGVVSRVATFTPRQTLASNSQYTATISGVKDTAGNAMVAAKTWTFYTGAVPIELEDARNQTYGSATFGDVAGAGHVLRDKNGFTLASYSINAGQSMSSLFDSGTSGPLASGKYVRIVVGGKNIMTGIGPGNIVLEPVRQDLTAIGLASPPANQCYVDPNTGRFMLPRPLYWSRLENLANISNPEIGVIDYEPESLLSGSFDAEGPVGMMFSGNGIYCANSLVNATATKDGTRSIKPFGNHALNFSKGTVSAWVKMHTSATLILTRSDSECNARLYLVDAPGFKVYIDSYLHTTWGEGPVMLNYDINGNTGYFQMPDNQNCHVYVVWDNEKGLGGNSLRIFVDGVNVLSSSASLPDLSSLVYGLSYRAYAWTFIINSGATAESYVYLDNLKIFNHVAVQDPSSQPSPAWEYNSGAGREDALHPIYGLGSGYRPVLTAPGGVGYFY